MKRLVIGVLMSLAFLNGIRIVMAQDATIADYEGLVGQAAAEMIQFRETWGDDDFFAISRSGDAYTLQRINGQDAIIMGPIVRREEPVRLRQEPIGLEDSYPVLGIGLSPKTRDSRVPDYIGDAYQFQIVPDSESLRFYMDKDEEVLFAGQSAVDDTADEEHWRLERIGQSDYQYSSSQTEYEYTPAADNILFTNEISYRVLWDAFGNKYDPVDPVLFTCGDYVPITPIDAEFYTDWHRAMGFFIVNDTALVIAGETIHSGTARTDRPWDEQEYIKQYTIPDDLVTDMWPEEMRNRCCLPAGEYELWDRGGNQLRGKTGVSYHWQDGASSQQIDDRYTLNQYNACLYSKNTYSGSGYSHELIFYSDDQGDPIEIVIDSGSSGDGHLPDEVYVNSFEMYDFHGKPVVVFGYLRYFSGPGYCRYGIYYNGVLHLTEEYPINSFYDFWHEVPVTDGESDQTLYGFAMATAFSINEIER